MPPAYRFTPRALDDLDEIWSYIAVENETAANRVESAILATCDSLARHPHLGSKRSEITPLPVRFWVVTRFPNFIVVYRPAVKPLQVVAVLHAKQDIKRLMEERGIL